MEAFIAVFIFIFGLIIGSFLNVVIYRYNTGETVGGRSICLSCGSKLSWKELIPVISFILQNGKCRACSSKISWQYPIVEIMVGTLFLWAFLYFSYTPILLYAFIQISILSVILVYDIRHKIIPNLFVYAFSFFSLGFIFLYAIVSNDWSGIVHNLIAGPLFFSLFALLWLYSKGKWMGFGDAKLVLGIGWFLGLANGYLAIVLSFWSGAFVGLLLIGIGHIQQLSIGNKKVTIKSEIPFAPFLIFGTIIMFLAETKVYEWLSIVIFW